MVNNRYSEHTIPNQYTEEENTDLELAKARLLAFLDEHERVRWGNTIALVFAMLNRLDSGQLYMLGLDLPICLKERTTALFNGLRAHGMR
jgi:hypothetical protein